MIQIDGSQGEGGGQILRSSLTLSLLTGKAFELRNIRANRSRPGLQPQHLMCVKAAARIGQADVRGASLHSSALTFVPGPITPGKYEFHIGTAGGTGLVLHTIYLPLAYQATAPSEVTLTGGTHNDHSPCFHFLATTWRAYMAQLGLSIDLTMIRSGFYPRGGGVVVAKLSPIAELKPLHLDHCAGGARLTGVSAVAGLPPEKTESVLVRQMKQAMSRLRPLKLDVEFEKQTWPGGPGAVVTLTLDTAPAATLFFGLGARGKLAERVADEAVDQFRQYLQTQPLAVDAHSADQLLLPLVLAKGASEYRVAQITKHLLTNISVVGRFVDRKIVCEGSEDEPGMVHIAE